jgi:hypothetical protein
MKYRLIKEIAEDLLKEYPHYAHLYALEKLNESHTPNMWREILTELDKLQGEKNACIELQKTEQHSK